MHATPTTSDVSATTMLTPNDICNASFSYNLFASGYDADEVDEFLDACQSMNGRVINTCNLSEDWVGYSTRYGDSAGDVSLLGKLTVQEVKALGHELGLPEKLVEKTPSDGLCGSTDEQKLGFTYAVLDRYIRDGVCEDESVRRHIDTLHKQNKFKLELIPTFEP